VVLLTHTIALSAIHLELQSADLVLRHDELAVLGVALQ
jgi:hypothetical protein